MRIKFKAGYYPEVLTMMNEGMSYFEYQKLKEEDHDKLLELFYFVQEKNKKQKEMIDKNKPNVTGAEPPKTRYKWVNAEDYK